MDTPLQSAISESLPENTDAALVESSTTDAGDSPAAPAETPAQQVEQDKEPPFHEHPRWKEMQEEKEYYKSLAREAIEAAKRPYQPQYMPNPQPTVDPYAGMSLEERAAYQKIEQFAENAAKKVIDQARAPIDSELRATRTMQATLLYERFRSQHPDIKPGSPEENAIANIFQQGKTLDEAYAIVKFPELQRKMAEIQTKTKEVKVQQKLSTPPEPMQSVPAISGVKTKSKADFRAELDKAMRANGY